MHVATWFHTDQSSPNSRNKCQLATPLKLQKFRRALTKGVPDICFQKFLTPIGREKLDQSSPKSPNTCYGTTSVIVSNFITLGQTMYEKSVTNFCYPPVNFGTRGGPLWTKFTNLGNDIQPGSVYECAKFCPILTTCIWDICCQTSLILLTAWQTKNSKWQVSAYHAATNTVNLNLNTTHN